MMKIRSTCHITAANITVYRDSVSCDDQQGTKDISRRLAMHHGAYFSSDFDFPERYSRCDMSFVNPPLMIETRGCNFMG